MLFVNPLRKYDVSDFPNVWIPLAEATRHPAVVAKNKDCGSDAPTSTAVGQDPDLEKKGSQHSTESDNSEATFTIEQLRAEVEAAVVASGHDGAYDRKATVVNKAIQDIGMGRYQWRLFCLCGFGWLADNLWLTGVALSLGPLGAEFGIGEAESRFTTLALFVGLCIGASIWGIVSDVTGRRPVFNLTLLICAVFGIACGAANTWVRVSALYALVGFGVGGSLPVDGALFLEFLPSANGNLLTLLSIWWPIGQTLASASAWGVMTNFSCTDSGGLHLPACSVIAAGVTCCTKSSNMGWRYLNFILGGLTFLFAMSRVFLFPIFESPKFLLGRGRQHEAVAAVYGMAHHNSCKTWLSEEILDEIGGSTDEVDGQRLSSREIIMQALGKFSTERIKPIFSSKRLASNSCLLWFIWATIGMGYPLFNAFLAQYIERPDQSKPPTPVDIVYRNYGIISAVGFPGSALAFWTVNIKYVGRKGTMAASTLLTGLFIILSGKIRDPKFQLASQCVIAFCQNIMYGVLYAYTPETFPAPNRGTGAGIASLLNRMAGICAPIVATQAVTTDSATLIYVAGGLMLSAFVAMLCLPIETRGRQVL